MDLQTRDRAAADVAQVPAGEPGVPQPGDGAGARPSRNARLKALALVVLVGAAGIDIAAGSGVVGKAAIPPIARAGLAAAALFAVGGFGLTRLLLPAGLRRYEPLWILPVGACAVSLAMTALGFAAVPFKLSLAVTLVAGAAVGAFAWRRSGPPGGFSWAGTGWPVYLAVILACVSLVPLFRAGFVTVQGQGQDAHLAVGTAQFLQKHYPTAIAPEEPVDRVPLVWRSKHPIYYSTGAVATLSGLEVYETLSTVAAMLLALACLGFFLVARELLRAPPWVALAAMGLVGLDRMVLHTVMHPYFNQMWGFFTMPFALVLTWWFVHQRTRGGAALLALFLAIGAFAYPLALPIALIPLAVLLWPERAALWRRLYHGRRSLRWMVPLGLVLILPIAGIFEKAANAAKVVVDPTFPLDSWGGDLLGWYPERWFFGADTPVWMAIITPIGLYGLWRGLRALPRSLALGLAAVLAFAAVFAVYFRLRDVGWYFHFKVLAFVAPLALVIAAAGLAQVRRRVVAVVAILVLLASARASAVSELGQTFDQLPRHVLALRSIDAALPAGQSIRLDIDPKQQNWVAYMLHGQPLCSQRPLLGTSYPHVRTSRKADYALTHERHRPADAVGGPVRVLQAFSLYRLRRDLPGRENCSRRMIQTVTNPTSGR
jgi:hypothetical protein